jgi:hypothetical protein
MKGNNMENFPEHDERGNERTPWAVYCPDKAIHNPFCGEDDVDSGCGLSYLTEADYEWQCEEGSGIFYCPVCGEVAKFLEPTRGDRLPGFEVQTRSKCGELRFFPSLKEALAHAETDNDVWKVSFALESGERVRLVRRWKLPSTLKPRDTWEYENILEEVERAK